MPQILYNVTVNIDTDHEKAWVEWMESEHIPEVMATGFFLTARLCKLLMEEESGTTYAVQYVCPDAESYRLYQELQAPRLQEKSMKAFGKHMVAFRTLLQIEGEWERSEGQTAGID